MAAIFAGNYVSETVALGERNFSAGTNPDPREAEVIHMSTMQFTFTRGTRGEIGKPTRKEIKNQTVGGEKERRKFKIGENTEDVYIYIFFFHGRTPPRLTEKRTRPPSLIPHRATAGYE